MEIKHIEENLFDVFWGNGWTNWARIKNNNGFLKQLTGLEIPKPIFSQLIQSYGKKKEV